MQQISKDSHFGLPEFLKVISRKNRISLDDCMLEQLHDVRSCIDYMITHHIKAYGLTTGFADLRDKILTRDQVSDLSMNLILSHDAGIGTYLPQMVTFGAMVARAASLAKGFSGIRVKSLETLLSMINCGIIPQVPRTGSLGASGDLAMLARLAMAMAGEDVPVWYEGRLMKAPQALAAAHIMPFQPSAKEGLALINGTSFSVSMMAIGYVQLLHELENSLAMQALFLNAAGAIEGAFTQSIQQVRGQIGQTMIAEILISHLKGSPLINKMEIQNDYCIRCLPQILGSKIELILEQGVKIDAELNAVTDNPLIFLNEEISSDVPVENIFLSEGKRCAVISGGNFHGEPLTTVADVLCMANAKIALTLERQITYVLNPLRNKGRLPAYLVRNEQNTGLLSGYMITQYTANALAQKIAALGVPSSIFNITSGNESEDIVSYAATAGERFLEQVGYLRELNTIYLTVMMQAYAIARYEHRKTIPQGLFAEQLFCQVQEHAGHIYPVMHDESFTLRYESSSSYLASHRAGKLLGHPFYQAIRNVNFPLNCLDGAELLFTSFTMPH